jgi:hypothetical protein
VAGTPAGDACVRSIRLWVISVRYTPRLVSVLVAGGTTSIDPHCCFGTMAGRPVVAGVAREPGGPGLRVASMSDGAVAGAPHGARLGGLSKKPFLVNGASRSLGEKVPSHPVSRRAHPVSAVERADGVGEGPG